MTVRAGTVATPCARQGTHGLSVARGGDDAAWLLCQEMLDDLAMAGVDP